MQDRLEFRTPILDNGVFIMFCYWNAVEGRPTYIELFGDNPRALSLGHDDQCTGQKDKNGNLIYDGDVVGFHIFRPDGEWVGCQGTIVWHNAGWTIEYLGDYIPLRTACVMSASQGIEIIGNIHTTEKE